MAGTFTLYVRTDNSAFDETTTPAHEVARILREIADTIEKDESIPWHFVTIRDINGNDVGRYALKDVQ